MRSERNPGWIPEMHNYEGIRVQYKGEDEDGWFLLRMSLHDPMMPLNVESNIHGGVGAISGRLLQLLNSFEQLGLEALYKSLWKLNYIN